MDLINGWKDFYHLQQLRRFRSAPDILEAAKDWLDKEIADVEVDVKNAYSILERTSAQL